MRTSAHEREFMLREENQRLREQQEALVTLVRFGFLVTVNRKRATAADVGNPELQDLLFTILQAEDTAAAITAVGSSPARESKP